MAHVHPPHSPSPHHPTHPPSLGFGFGSTSSSSQPMTTSQSTPAFGSFKRPAFAPPLQHSFALPPPQSPSTPLSGPSGGGLVGSPFGTFGGAPSSPGYFPLQQGVASPSFGSSPLKQQRPSFLPSSPSHHLHQHSHQLNGHAPNPRRRAREDDDDQGRGIEDFNMDADRGSGSLVHTGDGGNDIEGGIGRAVRGIKKSRVAPTSGAENVDGDVASSSNGRTKTKEDEVDVGVLLALLPQTSLLPILSSLLQLHPTLKADLLKLVPTPSLSTALESLRLAENKVKEAVPFGWSKSASSGGGDGGVSESYVLGRIGGPIEELAAQVSSQLPFFTSQPPPHPTLSFPYLSACTNLLLSLSSTLPAPLHPLSILWPRLAEEWLKWVARVSQLVNRDGGMVASGVAEGWIRGLDDLVDGKSGGKLERSDGQQKGRGGELEERIRREIGVVRERWIGEVGWLVGRRIEAAGQQQQYHSQQHVQQHPSQHDMMEEEEEL